MSSSKEDKKVKSDDRVYFFVPFAEKDQAKQLGAQWDIARGEWYAPADANLSKFARWRVEAQYNLVSPGSVFARPNRPPGGAEQHKDAKWMRNMSSAARQN